MTHALGGSLDAKLIHGHMQIIVTRDIADVGGRVFCDAIIYKGGDLRCAGQKSIWNTSRSTSASRVN